MPAYQTYILPRRRSSPRVSRHWRLYPGPVGRTGAKADGSSVSNRPADRGLRRSDDPEGGGSIVAYDAARRQHWTEAASKWSTSEVNENLTENMNNRWKTQKWIYTVRRRSAKRRFWKKATEIPLYEERYWSRAWPRTNENRGMTWRQILEYGPWRPLDTPGGRLKGHSVTGTRSETTAGEDGRGRGQEEKSWIHYVSVPRNSWGKGPGKIFGDNWTWFL